MEMWLIIIAILTTAEVAILINSRFLSLGLSLEAGNAITTSKLATLENIPLKYGILIHVLLWLVHLGRVYGWNVAMIADGDSCPGYSAIWLLMSKVKEVTKAAFGEGFYCPDDELLIDVAITFTHPVNLAYRYSHSLG